MQPPILYVNLYGNSAGGLQQPLVRNSESTFRNSPILNGSTVLHHDTSMLTVAVYLLKFVSELDCSLAEFIKIINSQPKFPF